MNLKTLPLGPYETNCTLLWNDQKEALVVDPAADAPRLLRAVEDEQLTPVAYLCTHGHADHINALSALHVAHPAPIFIHSADLAWAFSEINQIPPHYPVPTRPENADFIPLETTPTQTLAHFELHTLFTHGHTPGSVCFHFPEYEVLLSGDTLFRGSCGRTDLPGGSAREMRDSLRRLKQLPPQTRVFPGHGPSTSIAEEIAENFFMR